MTQSCATCGIEYPLTSFGRGRKSEHCKTCRAVAKACQHCKEVYAIEHFGTHGRHAVCRACRSRKANETYHAHAEAQALQVARSMNASLNKRTRGAVAVQVSAQEIAQLLLAAERCAYCQIPLAEYGAAVDHKVPLSKGGKHTLDNLTIAYQPCNRAKGNLELEHFERWLTFHQSNG